MARHDPDRLLVQSGFKHFRRTYSRREAGMGLLVFAVLCVISAWIWQRGKQRPDDIYGEVPLQGRSQPASASSVSVAPATLVATGWTETERSEFDEGNLYEKINGRADFFTSKGFERLHFVSLQSSDKQRTIDLELYDMGSSAGALSAFTAERKTGIVVTETATGQLYTSRNALFLVQGKYYGRALGSDESEAVTSALAEIRAALEAGLGAEQRSWAYELLVDRLGFSAGAVSFVGERAFSLESARDVWIAIADGDAEMFVSVRPSDEEAAAAAAALVTGFASYGKAAAARAGEPVFVIDQYLGSLATATTHGPFIIGVRGAPRRRWATDALSRIRDGIDRMGAETRARALASVPDGDPSVVDESEKEKLMDSAPRGEDNEPGGETAEPTTTEETY